MCVHWHLSLNSGCKVACSQALSTSAYANMEGEGLGDLVACDDVRRQTIDTLGAVPYCNNFNFASTCPWWNNEQYCSCLANALVSIPRMDIKRRYFKILHGHCPHVSTFRLPDVTTGGGEGQGMRFATRYASELEVGKLTRLK